MNVSCIIIHPTVYLISPTLRFGNFTKSFQYSILVAPINFPVALPRVPIPVWSGLLESNWKPTILPMLFSGAHPLLTCSILSFLSSVYGPGFWFFNALIALSVLSISLCLLSERNQLSLGNLLSKNRLCHLLYEGASPTQVIALDTPPPPPWGRVFLQLFGRHEAWRPGL